MAWDRRKEFEYNAEEDMLYYLRLAPENYFKRSLRDLWKVMTKRDHGTVEQWVMELVSN